MNPAAVGDAMQYMAFLRRFRRQAVLVVVPRFCNGQVREESLQLDTAGLPSLRMPDLPAGSWRNALSGEVRTEPPCSAAELFAPAPFAIWHTDNF
jgi:maltooligosyltrehalose synthase